VALLPLLRICFGKHPPPQTKQQFLLKSGFCLAWLRVIRKISGLGYSWI